MDTSRRFSVETDRTVSRYFFITGLSFVILLGFFFMSAASCRTVDCYAHRFFGTPAAAKVMSSNRFPTTTPREGEFVLLTGVAGFIGSHLAEFLLEKGIPIIALDNFDPFYDLNIKYSNMKEVYQTAQRTQTPFHFFEMDINDLEESFLSEVKITSIIHLAAKAGVVPSLKDPTGYVKANIAGTTQILEFARKRKIKSIVSASSSSVYGKNNAIPFREDQPIIAPMSPYAFTKQAGELICNNYCYLYGMKIAMLRFFTVYGPRQRPDLAIHKFSKYIANGRTIPLYGNGTARDYTFVSDIVDGIYASWQWSLKTPYAQCEPFNLGGFKKQSTSLSYLVELLERFMGKEAKLEMKPHRLSDMKFTYADLNKSSGFLDYHPKVSIEEGLPIFVKWYKEFNGIE